MTIVFDQVPAGTRVPFVFVEINSTNAQQGPAIQPYEILVIGQRLSTGTIPALTPTTVTAASQAAGYFGAGSQLEEMLNALFDNARDVPVRVIAQDDPAAAVKASADLTVTGTATASGIFYLYIGGNRLQVAVANADTATVVAASIASTITAAPSLPVTATSAGAVVTITAKHGGILGNDIQVAVSLNDGEAYPAGIGATVPTYLASGAGSPDYDLLWPQLENEVANVWILGDASPANLTSTEVELDTRWGPVQQRGAAAFYGRRGTHAELLTFGGTQNSKHLSCLPADSSPSSPWKWAAAAAAVVGSYGKRDPARPFQTLPLVGIAPPLPVKRFSFLERDLLLKLSLIHI